MSDFNKGDFTQQGVAGHVNANLRLNKKRLVNIDLTSDEEAEGCTITGTVKDLLNDKVYPIGGGGGAEPTVLIEEQTFQSENAQQRVYLTGDWWYGSSIDKINVVFDDVTYNDVPYDSELGGYGTSKYDEEYDGQVPTFDTYPFYIYCSDPSIEVNDTNTHTVSASGYAPLQIYENGLIDVSGYDTAFVDVWERPYEPLSVTIYNDTPSGDKDYKILVGYLDYINGSMRNRSVTIAAQESAQINTFSQVWSFSIMPNDSNRQITLNGQTNAVYRTISQPSSDSFVCHGLEFDCNSNEVTIHVTSEAE